MEPTLSEISNVRVDPEVATGTPAVVYDNRDLINNLNRGAQYHAENVWRNYHVFLNNMKELYRDIGEINKQPVMTEDREALRKETGEILKEIGSSPQSFFGGGAKFNEIQQRLAKLQSDTTQSKQDRIYNTGMQEFLVRNNELNTPENQSMVTGFAGQKLGSRQLYQPILPGLFDPDSIAKSMNEIVKQDYKASTPSADNQFINTVSGVKYDPEKYRSIAENVYNLNDARNVPLRETLKKRYDSLPDYIKKNYSGEKDPIKSWYLDLMDTYRKQDEMSTSVVSNPQYESPLDRYKAQSQRIAANASTLRAQKYAQLANKKMADMDDEEKKAIGFWSGVIDRVKDAGVKIGEGEELTRGDYIFSGDLPRGYRFMGGVGTDGKPIELEPLKTKNGVEYYKTKYYNTQDNSVLDKKFLTDKYNLYKDAGGSSSYNDYVKQLIKSGVIDLEVQGQTKQTVPQVDKNGKQLYDNNGKQLFEVKMTPSVANFQTAAQAARSISNKVSSDKEMPIFEEEPRFEE